MRDPPARLACQPDPHPHKIGHGQRPRPPPPDDNITELFKTSCTQEQRMYLSKLKEVSVQKDIL